MLSGPRIENLDGVVAKRRDEQPLADGIESEMVDSSFHMRKLNRRCQRKRLLSRGGRHSEHGARQRTHR